MLLVGDAIYASRGSYGPGLLTSIDINSGQPRWSSRGFANANLIHADGKIILLDEDGWLALAKPHPSGTLDILSKTRVLSHNAWTVPTLSGTTLYLRDRKIVMALNVGATEPQGARKKNGLH